MLEPVKYSYSLDVTANASVCQIYYTVFILNDGPEGSRSDDVCSLKETKLNMLLTNVTWLKKRPSVIPLPQKVAFARLEAQLFSLKGTLALPKSVVSKASCTTPTNRG